MDKERFQLWLDSYGHAWESQDHQAFASLFSDNVSYHANPFSEPLNGRSAILDYWSNVIQSQEQIRFSYEVLAITQDIGIAHWWVSFVHISSKTKVKLDGISIISLNSENCCSNFKQWWHWLEYS
jgi:hypothetical protein